MAIFEDIKITVVEEVIHATIVEEVISGNVSEEAVKATIVEEVIHAPITEEIIYAPITEEVIKVKVDSFCGTNPSIGGASGRIFVIGISSPGTIGNVVYETDTVPPNTVVKEADTDNNSVTITFMAEGGDNYSPVISSGSLVCSNLQEYSNDKRLFYGSITFSVTVSETIKLISDAGGTAEIKINRAAAGPEILTCLIGTPPGSQTAVKLGDIVHVTGTISPEATYVRIVDFGGFIGSSWNAVSNGNFDIPGVVNNATGIQTCKVEGKNSFGTIGNQFESTNSILLDQISPSFNGLGVTFPPGQLAFKDNESGTQETEILNFTDVLYSSPTGEFNISNQSTYEKIKTITATNSGNYNDSIVNFKIVATKTTNGTAATFNKIIEVADTLPILNITQPYARLRSSPTGYSYTISATSNQNMQGVPDIAIPVSGTWSGSSFTGGPKNFSRNIIINDSNIKGSQDWIFASTFYNNAGLSATISGTQVVGGFQPRDLTLEAFKNEISVNVVVIDYNKLKISSWDFTGDPLLRSSIINDVPPVPGYFTIDAVGVSPHIFRVLDTNKTLASSQATMIYNYEEEV